MMIMRQEGTVIQVIQALKESQIVNKDGNTLC